MNELRELRFNENNIQLNDNLVKGPILPEKASELDRTITIQGNTIIEGPVYAYKLEIRQGTTEIQGAVFTQMELYINSDARGPVSFRKTVASAQSIVSRATGCDLTFHADINAKSVTLYNAFVSGSIYADDIILQNCIVIGGVFATQNLDITNSMVGTFNSPSVKAAQSVWLLLPSAFSIEKIVTIHGTRFYNLSLADLGAVYKGLKQSDNSGKIEIDPEKDEVKSTLSDDQSQKVIRSYSVIGKVLAADLIDTDNFQNHFLISAASLGPQLLKTYDMGLDDKGEPFTVTTERIRKCFFDILYGRTEIRDMDGKFQLSDITGILS